MERFDSPMRPLTPPDGKTGPARKQSRSRSRSQLNLTGGRGANLGHLEVSTALVPVLFGILLLWNWRFALALLAGSFTMNATFALQSPVWQRRLKRALHGLVVDRNTLSVLLAASGGMVATLGTYTGISMWMTASDRWLTLGAIAQGLVSFGILCLLALQAWERPVRNGEESFEQALQGIASADPLARLLAVRQLKQYARGERFSSEQQQVALDYLRLALDKESEPKVREGLLQTLQLCGGKAGDR